MRVLYVEDNPVDIDLLKRHLQKAAPHIAVDAVRTQKEALSVLRGPRFCQYDLVLTDMRLPDGDGLAILSYIRANSLPLAVVVLTGQGDEETAVSVLKSGADDYLSKKKGYLERLPKLLEHAIRVYRSGEIKRAKSGSCAVPGAQPFRYRSHLASFFPLCGAYSGY
jgi:CheY-like chemotaxis protein